MARRSPVEQIPLNGGLACALVDFRSGVRAHRPDGRPDWLLTYTIGGRGRFVFGVEQRTAEPGDVTIIRPGAPQDYGVDPAIGTWKKIWVHFYPRVEAIAWLNWPEILPGHGQVRIDPDSREAVLESLLRMTRLHSSVTWRKADLAMNCLEHALLLCDGANPKHAETQRDSRIVRAVDAICQDLRKEHGVEDLARLAGLSRSRFVELFHRQIGMPPRDFVEQQRLVRAGELLHYSSMNVGQVAAEVGFDCPFYFSQRFKKRFGKSPARYRL